MKGDCGEGQVEYLIDIVISVLVKCNYRDFETKFDNVCVRVQRKSSALKHKKLIKCLYI